jgi:hypothetical protein
MMNVKISRSSIGLVCLAVVSALSVPGCGTGVSNRTDVNMLPKPMPDANHLVIKPGESKIRAFKDAFNNSRPGLPIH